MARKLKPRTPFAERLIAARDTMARKELAARLEAPLTTVAGWERGVSFPPPDMLVRISGLLGVSLDWLIRITSYNVCYTKLLRPVLPSSYTVPVL